MSDIIIAGSTYTEVPSILVPKVGGGFAEYTEEYSWMGKHCELIDDSLLTSTTYLKDTSYADWTASTTATVIKDSVNGKVVAIDLGNYDYMIEWLWCVDDVQTAGATMKAMPDRAYGAFYQNVNRRPYGLANFETETPSYNYCTNLYTSSAYNIYYNTSGNRSWTTTLYGVYCVNTAGTLSSTSSVTPNLTTKSPNITARCNASYFATARKPEIDINNTIIKIKGNLYRVEKNTSPIHKMFMTAVHMYNVPL